MRWTTWVVVVLAACSFSPQVVVAGDNTNELPFRLYCGYTIVARGSIGNLKNLIFVLDTGAVPSVLDRRLARELHLTGSAAKLSVFTQQVEVERVIVKDVRLGPFRRDALPAVVYDLSYTEQAVGTRVDAIIGFDLLSQSPFTIDYRTKKITVGPIDPALVAVPYHAFPGYAVVEMKIQQQTLLLLLDTGASDLVLFRSRYT